MKDAHEKSSLGSNSGSIQFSCVSLWYDFFLRPLAMLTSVELRAHLEIDLPPLQNLS